MPLKRFGNTLLWGWFLTGFNLTTLLWLYVCIYVCVFTRTFHLCTIQIIRISFNIHISFKFQSKLDAVFLFIILSDPIRQLNHFIRYHALNNYKQILLQCTKFNTIDISYWTFPISIIKWFKRWHKSRTWKRLKSNTYCYWIMMKQACEFGASFFGLLLTLSNISPLTCPSVFQFRSLPGPISHVHDGIYFWYNEFWWMHHMDVGQAVAIQFNIENFK